MAQWLSITAQMTMLQARKHLSLQPSKSRHHIRQQNQKQSRQQSRQQDAQSNATDGEVVAQRSGGDIPCVTVAVRRVQLLDEALRSLPAFQQPQDWRVCPHFGCPFLPLHVSGKSDALAVFLSVSLYVFLCLSLSLSPPLFIGYLLANCLYIYLLGVFYDL